MAWVTEQSEWVKGGSVDHFECALPKAAKRSRLIDPRVKEHVAEASSSGALGRSAAQVVRSLKRFRVRK
eukprot:11179870-Lingulodinium_polyedra.AAC.1